MITTRFLAASAALAAHSLSAQTVPDPLAGPPPIDSAFLAGALDGQALQLSMRGTSLTLLANATPAEDGCAALLTVQAPGSGRIWTRLLRWSELAWVGTTAEGATLLSFFEEEGRLPTDRVTFRPGDAARFGADLRRIAALCRTQLANGQPVAVAARTAAQGCHFVGVPALQLHPSDDPQIQPPRAVLSVLARETPEAELQVLIEQAPGEAAMADEWGRPLVTFTFADPQLRQMGIATARFGLDGRPLAAEHSLVLYGDTRLRISMDPFKPSAPALKRPGFFRDLAAGEEATLTLLDGRGRERARLSFDVGMALAAARGALGLAKWSCDGAAAPPPPAAAWRQEG